MKISQSLRKKIKSPNFVGFASASLIYLIGGTFLFDFFSTQNIKLKQEGNHAISLRISSINNGGNEVRFTKEQLQIPPQTKPHPKTQKPKKPHKKQKKKDKPAHKPIHKQQQIVQQEIPRSNLAQKGEHQAQTLAYNEGVSDEFLSKIRDAISTHNQYPRIARVRKIEGEVIVEFILAQNGIIEELKIIESRAEEVLQKSALKAVQKASRFFPPPPQRVRIRVPIVYHLKA